MNGHDMIDLGVFMNTHNKTYDVNNRTYKFFKRWSKFNKKGDELEEHWRKSIGYTMNLFAFRDNLNLPDEFNEE
jgi:hypothetical protein